MPKFPLVSLLLAATFALTVTPPATLAGHRQQLVAQRGDSGTSLNEAVQQVQRETGGRVLSADTVNQGGRRVHRIKVLTPSGQVRVVVVDAGR